MLKKDETYCKSLSQNKKINIITTKSWSQKTLFQKFLFSQVFSQF